MGKLAKLMGMSVHVKLTHKMIKIAYIHKNWTPWKLPTYHTVHVYTPVCCSLLSIHTVTQWDCPWHNACPENGPLCVIWCTCALYLCSINEARAVWSRHNNYMHCIKLIVVLLLLYPACSCKGYYCNTVHVHVSDMSVYLPSSIVIIVVIVCTYM